MKKQNITVIIASILAGIYLLTMHMQSIASLAIIDEVISLNKIQITQQEDLGIALQRARGASWAILMNVWMVSFLTLITLTVSIISLLKNRKPVG